ncbi:histidine kinase [Rhodobacteraceae bacterium WD3A24]|nr:histidine kinase [Rhodobacteraceae bacterium WD3A24]
MVIGEDWVSPQSSSDSEIRADRARRGVFSLYRSPLARKIILFNLLALGVLVVGVLLTGPFRDGLLEERQRALIARAEVIADALGPEGATAVAQGRGPEEGAGAAGILGRLSLEPGMELVLFDDAGDVVSRRMGEFYRRSTPAPPPGQAPQPTLLTDFLAEVWGGLSRLTGPDDTADPDAADAETRLRALLESALSGRSAAGAMHDDTETLQLAAVAPLLDEDGNATGALGLAVPGDDIAERARRDREQVLQMFVVALLVSVGLSLVLASTIANPLADLAAAAELGRDRNAGRMSPSRVRIPDLTGRPDEIGRLSVAMRGMTAALYDRIEANEQFASDVAHEIKNPLASLRSAVGTLRVARREEQREKLLDVIEHDVRRLDRLVSDTSNASKLDSELVKEQEESFNLCKTLENLGEHLSQEAAAKGVEFIADFPREPIMIQGLEARLAQVFVNLITNAISFCEEGDAVRIWARKRENRVLVVVEDTGPGIPEEALGKIFNRFYSQRPERQFGNHSGLGLAISKQIVEAHGGVIWAENIRPTEADPTSDPLGARFVVGLPV